MSPVASPRSGTPPQGHEEPEKRAVWPDSPLFILASTFQPPHIPCPKPWHRVRVPAVRRWRQAKIWKRISGLGLGLESPSYLAAVAELEGQDKAPRKRARCLGYVPILADGRWDTRAHDLEDGQGDLERAIVIAANDEATPPNKELERAFPARPAAFPELHWVPRKRNSARWPIEPKKKAGSDALRPPVQFKTPEEELIEADGQSTRQDAKNEFTVRRESRRVSILIGDDLRDIYETPKKRKSPVPSLTPFLSPIKRLLATPSPRKVVASPRKDFRLVATPLEVVIEPPSEEKSHLVVEPASGTPQDAQCSPSPTAGPSSPLIFDQPLPQVLQLPEHESKRRTSLQAALRRESQAPLSGPTWHRVVEENSSRRHSLGWTAKTQPSKARRHTLNPLSIAANISEQTESEPRSKDHWESEQVVVAPETVNAVASRDSTVVVDVGTNLDIFGQMSPPLSTPSIGQASSQEMANADQMTSLPAPSLESRIKADIQQRVAIQHLSLEEGDTTEGDTTLEEMEEADADASRISVEEPCPRPDSMEQDPIYNSQDPDGLPTIHEEDSQQGIEPELEYSVVREQGVATAAVESADIRDRSIEELADTAANSPTPSDDTVLTPDEDCCGPVLLDLSTNENAELENASVSADSIDQDTHLTGVMMASQGCNSELALSHAVEQDIASSPAMALPSTPPSATVPTPTEPGAISAADDVVLDTPQGSPSGFTPINGNTPTQSPRQPVARLCDEAEELGEDGPCEYEEPTVTIDGIFEATEAMVGCDDEDDALDDALESTEDMTEDLRLSAEDDTSTALQDTLVVHEDSETEMLRQFVTRVKADKTAKAATAGQALTRRKLGPKRRSGSVGSTTSSTGSPVHKPNSPPQRRPLGEKDRNSPSPRKRRKPDEGDHIFKGKPILASEEPSPQPKQKRRRKRLDAELETTLEAATSQLDDSLLGSSESGPRRSSRTRTTRIPLKPTAYSANSAVLSMIPVRLPGQAGMLGDASLDSNLVAARHRSEEKDLAAITRVNTRKNKGSSVPAKMVLARQAEDPTWKMKELKGVFDAMENRQAEATEKDCSQDGRKSRKENRVRWAETLATYQGDIVAKTSDDEMTGELDEELAASAEIATEPAAEKVEKQVAKKPARRTRASKLQPPTPIKKTPVAEQEPTVKIPSAQSRSSASARGMSTRRAKVASLGMSSNGTPAPKRRTRTVA